MPNKTHPPHPYTSIHCIFTIFDCSLTLSALLLSHALQYRGNTNNNHERASSEGHCHQRFPRINFHIIMVPQQFTYNQLNIGFRNVRGESASLSPFLIVQNYALCLRLPNLVYKYSFWSTHEGQFEVKWLACKAIFFKKGLSRLNRNL